MNSEYDYLYFFSEISRLALAIHLCVTVINEMMATGMSRWSSPINTPLGCYVFQGDIESARKFVESIYANMKEEAERNESKQHYS